MANVEELKRATKTQNLTQEMFAFLCERLSVDDDTLHDACSEMAKAMYDGKFDKFTWVNVTMKEVMSQIPDWVIDPALIVEGWSGKRFRK